MNRIYKTLFNRTLGVCQVVSEQAKSRTISGRRALGHSGRGSQALPVLLLSLSAPLLSPAVLANALPESGTVVQGSAHISQLDANTLNIHQHTDKAILNWESFSIGSGNTVNFQQLNSQSVALNRVIGNDASAIYGNLNANGNVFLVNQNGVLFAEGANINVGGLVASTLDIRDQDFLNGHYTFEGSHSNSGLNSVINRGHITADGGAVALLGGHVSNHGIIRANLGSVALAAGEKITLDFAGDGLINLTIDQGQLNALVENHGAIQADGGSVFLTTHAADQLLNSVVNNTGMVRAQTVAQREGKIILLADMQNGTVNVDGILDASALDAGHGGFIDTSAANVQIEDSVHVTTLAQNGQTGTWLIDPTDFTIYAGTGGNVTGGSAQGSGIGAETLRNNLATNNVVIETVTTGSAVGDIHVSAAVSWNAPTTLTLNAHNNININAPITVQHASGGLALNHGGFGHTGAAVGSTGYVLNAPVSFTAGSGGSFSVNNTDYTLIHNAVQLNAMRDDLTGHYALAVNVDASVYTSWSPIGSPGGFDFENAFRGVFDGLGHTIHGVRIAGSANGLGLFGATDGARLRHVGLVDVNIEGYGGSSGVGGLVGSARNTHISKAFSSGDVFSPHSYVGGLVGRAGNSVIEYSYATGNVGGADQVGGLVGYVVGIPTAPTTIRDSYSRTDITNIMEGDYVGGLIGMTEGPAVHVTSSYYDGQVSGFRPPGTGLTSAQIMSQGSFNWRFSSGVAGSDAVWRIYEGQTAPLLRVFMTPLEILPVFDGSGAHLSDIAVLDDAAYQAALSNPQYTGWLQGDLTQGDTLIVSGGHRAGEYRVTTNAVSSLYSHQQGFDIILTRVISDSAVQSADAIALSNGVSWDSGTLRIDTGGTVSAGTIHGGADSIFELARGNWIQNDATLADFSVNDFRLSPADASFVRVLGGDGSENAPYRIADVYGLQGMASYSLLANHFELANSINASTTEHWNDGWGFNPIGDNRSFNDNSRFTGTLDGLGNVIDGLTIRRPSTDYVGLFGYAGSATIRHMGLENVAVNGYRNVGGLSGRLDGGSITQIYVTGAVRAEDTTIGGLVGLVTNGSITQSYVTATVDGASGNVGGLVGTVHDGSIITQSYTTGAVSGRFEFIGGLVGNFTNSSILQSYATGMVSGLGVVGGLVGGQGSGTITQSYATGAVEGREFLTSQSFSIGGLVGQFGASNSVITQSYATGAVTGDGRLGGLIGHQVGVSNEAIISSFYATTAMDQNGNVITINNNGDAGGVYIGNNEGTGVALANLMTLGTFDDPDTNLAWDISDQGGDGSVWRIYDGHTTPLLRNFLSTLTVQVNDENRTYNGTVQNATGSVQFIPEAYDPDLLNGTGTYTGAGRNAGTYAISLNGLYSGQQGYDLVIQEGTLNIERATLTLQAVTDTRTYDGGVASAGHVLYSGLIDGDSISQLQQIFGSRNAGARTLHVADGYVINDGNGGNNYTVTRQTAAGEITPRTLTAQITADNKIYDGSTDVSLRGLLDGIVGSDEVALVLSGQFADADAGDNKTVVLTTSLSGNDAGNYVLDAPDNVTASIIHSTLPAGYDDVLASITQRQQSASAYSAQIPAAGDITLILEIDTDSLNVSAWLPEASLTPEQLAEHYLHVQQQAELERQQIALAALFPEPGSVLFPVNSVQIEDEEGVRRLLTAMVGFLQANPTTRVQLVGHADQTGPEAHNQQLSEQRAQAVAGLLTYLGVGADQIQVMGAGSDQPLREGSNREALASNRRVDFSLP